MDTDSQFANYDLHTLDGFDDDDRDRDLREFLEILYPSQVGYQLSGQFIENNLCEEPLELGLAPTANNDTQEPSAQHIVPTPPYNQSDQHDASQSYGSSDEPLVPTTVPHDQEPAPLPEELNKDEVVTCIKTLLMPLFLACRKPQEGKCSMHIEIGKYDEFMKMLNKGWELLRNREELALFYNNARQAIIEDEKHMLTKAKHMLTKANSINKACINERKLDGSTRFLEYRKAIEAAYGYKDCSSSESKLLMELYECFGTQYKSRKKYMFSLIKNPKKPQDLTEVLDIITKDKEYAEKIPLFADSVSEKQVGWMNLDNKIRELIENIDEKLSTNIVTSTYMVAPNHIMEIRKKIIEIFKQHPSYEGYMPNIKLSVTEEYVFPPYTNIGPGYLVKAGSLRHERAKHVLTLSVKFDDAPPISENLTSLKRDLWQGINGILSPSLITRLDSDRVVRFRAAIRKENLGESSTAEPLLPEITPDSQSTPDSKSSPDSQSSLDSQSTLGSQSTKRKSTTTLTPTEATAPKRAKNTLSMKGVPV